MPYERSDEVHDHPCWHIGLRAAYCRDGELHRHRIASTDGATRFTGWAHNTAGHTHRLPDGSFTRPRRDLTPPAVAVPVL